MLNNRGDIASQKVWLANRTLARDLPGTIDDLVAGDYDQLDGVVAFRGPGSFTGLRIGITVANAIAYGRNLPIVGTSGDTWLADGIKQLSSHCNDQIVLPEYGAAPHITPAKK